MSACSHPRNLVASVPFFVVSHSLPPVSSSSDFGLQGFELLPGVVMCLFQMLDVFSHEYGRRNNSCVDPAWCRDGLDPVLCVLLTQGYVVIPRPNLYGIPSGCTCDELSGEASPTPLGVCGRVGSVGDHPTYILLHLQQELIWRHLLRGCHPSFSQRRYMVDSGNCRCHRPWIFLLDSKRKANPVQERKGS